MRPPLWTLALLAAITPFAYGLWLSYADAQPIPPQCHDSVDLPWRCYVVSAQEASQAMQALEDACFEMDKVELTPWRWNRAGYVDLYLVVGREGEGPCP